MSERKKILICPLNWGLGHATRDIPIIKLFVKQKFDVIIAASGDSLELLNYEFPNLESIDFISYTVRYSKSKSQIFRMLLLIPKIFFWTVKEHNKLKEVIKKHNIDIVFSDNRFGLWNRKTYNIFMTHQLVVKFPGFFKLFEPVYQFLITLLIKKYNECWIPDFEGTNNLSGELSHVESKLSNRYYIGPLSRFVDIKSEDVEKNIDVLFILSGPEPQRTMFENLIYEQTKISKCKFVIVRGTSKTCKNIFNFPVYNVVNTEKLLFLIKKAELIVCRSGYTSVMDLYLLKKKAVLVSTPGQTEQEYLAKYLMKREIFYSTTQEKFDLLNSIEKAFVFPDKKIETQNLEEKISSLKEKQNHKCIKNTH